MIVLDTNVLSELMRPVKYMERSPTAWRPYLWPIKITMCIGIALMILQCVSELIKDVFRVRGEKI